MKIDFRAVDQGAGEETMIVFSSEEKGLAFTRFTDRMQFTEQDVINFGVKLSSDEKDERDWNLWK